MERNDSNLIWKNKLLEYLRVCIMDICFLILFFFFDYLLLNRLLEYRKYISPILFAYRKCCEVIQTA